MILSEYLRVCARLEAYCTRARESGRFEGADTLEYDLRRCEYAEKDWRELSRSCEELQTVAGRSGLIAKYRKELAVFEQIRALSDDVEAGAVSCPAGVRALLVHRLNGICEQCAGLSRICFAVFDKMQPEREQKSVPEMIEGNPAARALAVALQGAGYLDTEYKFIYKRGQTTRPEEGRAGQALADCFPARGMQKKIAEHWGISAAALKSYAGSNGNTGKINAIINTLKNETI